MEKDEEEAEERGVDILPHLPTLQMPVESLALRHLLTLEGWDGYKSSFPPPFFFLFRHTLPLLAGNTKKSC
jgi:hypothetical protein